MQLRLFLTGIAIIAAIDGTVAQERSRVAPPAPRVNRRHPMGMTLTENRLFIANHRGGTLSRIDTDTNQVLNEKAIGESLSDLCAVGDGRVLIVDETASEVVVVREQGEDVVVLQRVPVATSPVSIIVSPTRQVASVASLWARRITLMDLATEIRVRHTIDLPFAPRMQLCMPDGKRMIVADAFRGRLAVIDTLQGKVTTIRDMDAHNIRGLALSHDGASILVAHQTLISHVPTTENRISWGQVVSNLLREIKIEDLLDGPEFVDCDQPTKPLGHWGLEPLGEHKNAAGDPGQIAVDSAGRRIVCLSGVDEVAIGHVSRRGFARIKTGLRPTNVVTHPHRGIAYVANTFADSISVVDLDQAEIVNEISLGRTPALSLADRGEHLFYDAELSFDGWFSCHSCHPDGHTTGLLNDNLGDASYGAPKRILSLLGTNDTGPWGWNGSQFWINDQVVKSIDTTMRHTQPHFFDDASVGALTDYLRSLQPPPSLLAARGESLDTARIRRGALIFERYDCDRCHAPPTYTSERIVDVGLEDEVGHTEFNPPALRGVSQQDAWLHDNRAKSLRDVFEKFGHPDDTTLELSSTEVGDLVWFLNSL